MSSSGAMVDKPSAVRHQGLAFAILAVIFAACALNPTLLVFGVSALVALVVAGYFVFQAVDGKADTLTLVWIGLFPLGYYFLSFPREQTIVTFDRVAVSMMAVALAFCPRTNRTPVPRDMRKAAWAWLAFLAAGLLSLVSVAGLFSPLRTWVEVFLLPAILGWYIIACFPVRIYLRLLHVLACVAAIYSAAIGAAEVVLGTDLLAFRGAGETFAGAQDVLVLRVNGPYGSNNSFGLIGLVSFCLIWFLRSAIADKMPRWQRALNALGITAALLAAMLPLFRSIFLTFALILIVDLFRQMTVRQRVLRLGVLGLIATAVVAVMLSVPEVFQERVSDPGNIYGRLAQQKQNFRLFLDHPVLGVGLANFMPAAASSAASTIAYEDVFALGSPHSNVGAVLAETGLVGFVPYAVSNCLLVVAFWRLRRDGRADSALACRFFIYIFLSYWISGLALTSGYYSDLNLCYLFSVAVIYKYAITTGLTTDRALSSEG